MTSAEHKHDLLRFELAQAPDALRLLRSHPDLFPCLLESAARGQAPARYDLLLIGSGEFLALDGKAQLHDQSGALGSKQFLPELRARWRALPSAESTPELPFQGGYALFLAYEFASQLESSLDLPADPCGLPMALAIRCPAVLQYDHERHVSTLYCEPTYPDLASQVLAACAQASALPAQESAAMQVTLREDPPERYLSGVRRIKQYLAAGDIFQANLSRAWEARADTTLDPVALYQRLRTSNPAPFAGFLRHADWQLLSSSPERLLRVVGDKVESRPIAGTRARRADDADWLNLPRDPKERAEHVMLIDLVRNDLGRVCRTGTVEVNELLRVESYAHVHHIVSNVRGLLRSDRDALDALAAVFPGGTITGCPKLRAIQIIAELEQTGRGPYTGALGYLSRGGSLDMNILIRSIWMQQHTLHFRAGAGIVADSVPERELAETRAKAEGLLRALR